MASLVISPGGAAVCRGEVAHRRTRPAINQFTYRVSFVWLDPDAPDELCRHHRLWSAHRPAPAWFRRTDYGDRDRPTVSLGEQARDDLFPVLGYRPSGEVRMLTQARRWGWLFNPISVMIVWAEPGSQRGPVGAVLEVTNTPWKERHRYAVALHPVPSEFGCRYETRLDKELHVSPFLGLGYRYDVALEESPDGELCFSIDVVADRAGDDEHAGADAEAIEPVLHTALSLRRTPASAKSLRRALVRDVLPTHRVSVGIHWQALRLWFKRVPFVRHPKKTAE